MDERAVRVKAAAGVVERLAECNDVFVLDAFNAKVDRASARMHAADRGRSITRDDEELRRRCLAEVIGDALNALREPWIDASDAVSQLGSRLLREVGDVHRRSRCRAGANE